MAVDSISVGNPTVTRSGNTVNISFSVSTTSKNGAYYHQVRVNGSVWKTSSAYGTVSGTYSTSINTAGGGSQTYKFSLYVQWQQGGTPQEYTSTTKTATYTAATYTVTFNPGTGGSVSPTSKTVTYSSTYGDLPNASLSGANFSGWYDAEQDGNHITSTTQVTKTSNHTLYAYYDYTDEGAVSKITMLSGTTYNIKDEVARSSIASLQTLTTGKMTFLGFTSTELTDGSTSNPIDIGGTQVLASNGGVALYGSKEFIFTSADSQWHTFGDWGDIGDLAYKAAATGEVTPSGSVGVTTFSGSAATITTNFTITGNVSFATSTSGTANYTPAGSISTPIITVTPSKVAIYGVVNSGTQDTMATTVSSEIMTLSFTAGAVPSRTSSTNVIQSITSASSSALTFTGSSAVLVATFSGSAATATASYKPTGTVSTPGFTGTSATITVS